MLPSPGPRFVLGAMRLRRPGSICGGSAAGSASSVPRSGEMPLRTGGSFPLASRSRGLLLPPRSAPALSGATLGSSWTVFGAG
eukprot:8510903-Alexandrium_andersonii.AAC.1